MHWFLNLRIGIKLFLGFGVILALLVAAIYTAHTSIAAIQASQRTLFEEDFANSKDLLTLGLNDNAVRNGMMTLLATTDPAQQSTLLDEIKTTAAEQGEISSRLLQRYAKQPESLRRIQEWRTIRDAYKLTRETEAVPAILAGKIEEAKEKLLGIQRERYLKMSAITEELGKEAEDNARRSVNESDQRIRESVRLFQSVGISAVLLGFVMSFLINRVVAVPISQVAGVAAKIAAGDLTVSLPAGDRKDEVGMLTQTFRQMTDNLRALMQDILEAVTVLASSATEIMASTTQLASSAAETATAITETTATVEEVKQTSQLSSQKAKSVSDESQKAAEVARGGKRAVDQTIEGMNGIRQQMGAVAESILSLSAQSHAIGEIISTVDDLAAQSKLLAVNASIEAAKAGEEGKGFSVVAQEVKSLAEQSKQATTQVRGILNDIQKATGSAVLATEQGSKSVEAGVRQSGAAGESIGALSDSIAEAAQAAAQIAATSQQQFVGMDQVALAMENIKLASTQTVASTKQAETAAQQLHDLGQKLKQLVTRFKV